MIKTAYDFEQLEASEQKDLFARWNAPTIARLLNTASKTSAIRKMADKAGWVKMTPPAHAEGWAWDDAKMNWTIPPPPPEPEPVPDRLTPRQIRLALRQLHGITPAHVDAAIKSLDEPERTDAQIEWMYATRVERLRFDELAAAFELTSEQVDDLFIVGAEL